MGSAYRRADLKTSTKSVPPPQPTTAGVPDVRQSYLLEPGATPSEAESKTIRARRHSQQFLIAFKPILLFLQAFGRFPFKTVLKDNGTYAFRFATREKSAIVFFSSSIIMALCFCGMTLGFLSQYLRFTFSEEKDRCNNNWESATVARQIVPLALVYTQIGLTVYTSFMIIFFGKQFVHYFNHWNRAIQSMDLDPTATLYFRGVAGNVYFAIYICFIVFCYFTHLLPSLQDICGIVAQSVVHLHVRDIYRGNEKPFGVVDYFIQQKSCSNSSIEKTNVLINPPASYKAWKLFGFLISIYGIIGGRGFMLQYKFFCKMLENLCYIWSSRLIHGFSSHPPTHDSQSQRRVNMQMLLKDHHLVVQLFKLTVKTFGSVVAAYYINLYVNICAQFYYLALLPTQKTCSEAINDEIKKYGCTNYDSLRNYGTGRLVFEDPCTDLFKARLAEVALAVVMIFQNMYSFWITTIDADKANTAMLTTFNSVRRLGYIEGDTRPERLFFQGLYDGYPLAYPPILTAGGFFLTNRSLILKVLFVSFFYFLLLVQLKPGQIITPVRCRDANNFIVFNSHLYPEEDQRARSLLL